MWGKYYGGVIEEFCSCLKDFIGREYVWFCFLGIVVVELVLWVFRFKLEDEVIFVGYDFFGNFCVIEVVGVILVVCDIDFECWVLDFE